MKKINIVLLIVSILLIIFCLVTIFGSDLGLVKDSIFGSQSAGTNPTYLSDTAEEENTVNETDNASNTVNETTNNTISEIADMIKNNNEIDDTTIASRDTYQSSVNKTNTTNETNVSNTPSVANNTITENTTDMNISIASTSESKANTNTTAKATENTTTNNQIKTNTSATTNNIAGNELHNTVNQAKLPAAGFTNIILWILGSLAIICIVSMIKYNTIKLK